ncbi:MAG: type II toxin-antitoxin system HicB family antitoxin [Microvirga sp.]
MRYRVEIEPDDNDTYLVTCPDIPEVTTFGRDRPDALVHAVDAIITALQGRINARQDIPVPANGAGQWVELGALVEAKVELYRIMRHEHVTKAELGRRLRWHGPSVDRLLDLGHDSRLLSLEMGFRALSRELHIGAKRMAA